VEALVCFACACQYPVVHTQRSKRITWHCVGERHVGGASWDRFLGLTARELEGLLSYQAYVERYGEATFTEDLSDWLVDVPLTRKTVRVLCCAEDRRCDACAPDSGRMCRRCEVPLCAQCAKELHASPPRLPEAALANDMFTGYMQRYIYEQRVTAVELICASACLTSLICFSMEVEFGPVYKEEVHMQRHRLGARGNTTCFPLPMERLVEQLVALAAGAPSAATPTLPRTGVELADVVRVVLKGAESDAKRFITQATVRRAVVIELILGAKRRGHPAYQTVDELTVRRRAEQLPVHGVPEELVGLCVNDESIERLRPQKAATPIEGRTTPSLAFELTSPNAVVAERTGTEGDINAKRITALENFATQLRREDEALDVAGPKGHDDKVMLEMSIQTGSTMLDQFQPQFFALAFAFLFNACVACPDIERRPRYRRGGAR
jgi:hypothetical protein